MDGWMEGGREIDREGWMQIDREGETDLLRPLLRRAAPAPAPRRGGVVARVARGILHGPDPKHHHVPAVPHRPRVHLPDHGPGHGPGHGPDHGLSRSSRAWAVPSRRSAGHRIVRVTCGSRAGHVGSRGVTWGSRGVTYGSCTCGGPGEIER